MAYAGLHSEARRRISVSATGAVDFARPIRQEAIRELPLRGTIEVAERLMLDSHFRENDGTAGLRDAMQALAAAWRKRNSPALSRDGRGCTNA